MGQFENQLKPQNPSFFTALPLPSEQAGPLLPPPDALTRETLRLIRSLGSEDFEHREEAEAKLTKLAEQEKVFFAILDHGLLSSDVEIRKRSERIIESTGDRHDAARSKAILSRFRAELEPLGIQVRNLNDTYEAVHSLFPRFQGQLLPLPDNVIRYGRCVDALKTDAMEDAVLRRQWKKENPNSDEDYDTHRNVIRRLSGAKEVGGWASLYFWAVQAGTDSFPKPVAENPKRALDRLLEAALDLQQIEGGRQKYPQHENFEEIVRASGILERNESFRSRFEERYPKPTKKDP